MTVSPLQLGIAGHFSSPADAVTRRAERAEAGGWDSVWWPDAQIGYHPAAPGEVDDPHEVYDWGPMMGATAVVTQRVALGVSVTDPFRRHPGMLAQTAQTLHDLSHGRFILGLGLGAIENLTPFGLEGSSKVAVLEEALDVMHLLWSTTEPVSIAGPTWSLDRAVLGVDSTVHGAPPVWIGGTGPRSLDLTGRKADGWIPVMPAIEDFRRKWALVVQGAERAGRDPDAVTAGCLFLTVAGEDLDALDRMLDTPWVRALALSQPASQFERLGHQHPLGELGSGMRGFVPTHWSLSDYRALVDGIPLDVVKELVLWGDGARLAEQLSAYADAGLQHAVIWNATGMGMPSTDEVRSSFRAIDDARARLQG